MKTKIKARIVQFAPENTRHNFYVIQIKTFLFWNNLYKFDKRYGEWTDRLITWDGINAYWRYFVENITIELYNQYMEDEYKKEKEYCDGITYRQTKIIAKNY